MTRLMLLAPIVWQSLLHIYIWLPLPNLGLGTGRDGALYFTTLDRGLIPKLPHCSFHAELVCVSYEEPAVLSPIATHTYARRHIARWREELVKLRTKRYSGLFTVDTPN
ncbi:hypothetical protein F5B22DRAFT_607730 [Xylaria bambusicola]|uniref:uncharacterized protein n=1 Tax=Xylaria bambusicola TaxID=326684 RepID=UPI002007427A|nr:uncharacterized protein F5B22DRAFT_607730 [Xylaria bambusicola]KAI0515257.1 hypothetical protein F5B22DRAFT_607730 [Xylaria bambusicola]